MPTPKKPPTTSIRNWPRRERQSLLKGPKATVELDAGSESKPRLVLTVPRAALTAFSTVAASLLADAQYTNVLLPPGMAAPAALRYLIEWIPRACDSADFMPIKRKEGFEHNVRIYQAALSLGVTEALVTVGGWLNLAVSAFERQPWPCARVLDLLTTLPKDCALVGRLIEKVALARRRHVVDAAFEAQLAAFLAACPELAERFRVEDDPELRGGKLRRRSGSEASASSNAGSDGRDGQRNGSNDGSGNGGGGSARRRPRGGRKGRGGSPKTKTGSGDYGNNYRVLDDADVDFLMGRGR
ncbi:uncharacterized protein BKCO1_1090006 [Diplodia corticola]|uniref:Uncharacterized protein n=1 Tax=Diplodia corticola TaxID=236234 RepID=A0A1J9QIZ5_9PEZI|nr:uncharacterized protein BKCO1_1090006 [Diplodia corticola]OJD28830.1 hypothetical protein BKCO1_1090006 [Diplodia corticola]